MGGSTTQSSSYMPSGQSGGFPAGPSFGMGQWGGDGMGQFGGYGGGLGGYGGGFGGYGGGGFGGYGGGFPQTGNGKGFQPMPPQRPQAQYAPMQFLPPQFAQPRFMYPSVAGQMAGQRPVALPQQRYQQPSPAYPFPPVSGGGKGFQGGPRQPMPPGPRPLPIAPRNPGGGPQPFMPGGQQDQFAQLTDANQDPYRGVSHEIRRRFDEPVFAQPAVMPREETEPRETTMPVGGGAYQGDKFSQMQQAAAEPVQQTGTAMAAGRSYANEAEWAEDSIRRSMAARQQPQGLTQQGPGLQGMPMTQEMRRDQEQILARQRIQQQLNEQFVRNKDAGMDFNEMLKEQDRLQKELYEQAGISGPHW